MSGLPALISSPLSLPHPQTVPTAPGLPHDVTDLLAAMALGTSGRPHGFWGALLWLSPTIQGRQREAPREIGIVDHGVCARPRALRGTAWRGHKEHGQAAWHVP